jgi:hypothetical protein
MQTRTPRFLAVALFPLSFLTTSASGQASYSDTSSYVNALLSKFGALPWTHPVAQSQMQRICFLEPSSSLHAGPTYACTEHSVSSNVMKTTEIIPTATQLRVISNTPLVFGKMKISELPNQVVADQREMVNCSEEVTNPSIQLSESFQRTTAHSISQSITNTASYGVNFGWKITPTITLGTNLTIGESTTSINMDTTQLTMVTQHTATLPVTLQKDQGIIGELEIWPMVYSQDFQTIVTIDAVLSPNDRFHLLSQMYPDPKSRTFPITGTLTFEDSTGGITVAYDDPNAVALCANKPAAVEAITPANGAILVRRSQ